MGLDLSGINQIIDDVRLRLHVPNERIALGWESMHEFDVRMKKIQAKRVMPKVHAAFLVLSAIYFRYYRFAVAAVVTLVASFILSFSKTYGRWQPFFLTSSEFNLFFGIRSLMQLRKTLPSLASGGALSQSLKVYADRVFNSGVAHCDELCNVITNELKESLLLNGMCITKIYLRDSSQPKHDHSVLLVSTRSLNLTGIQCIAQLNGDVTIVDPWYQLVLTVRDFLKTSCKRYPLLHYDIVQKDYELFANNNTQPVEGSLVR